MTVTPFHHLSFVHYNVQSIVSKLKILHAELIDFDLLAFTETWLFGQTTLVLKPICLLNLQISLKYKMPGHLAQSLPSLIADPGIVSLISVGLHTFMAYNTCFLIKGHIRNL